MGVGSVVGAAAKKLGPRVAALGIPGFGQIVGSLIAAGFTIQMIAGLFGVGENEVEAAANEATTRQNIEKRKVMGDQRTEALGKGLIGKMMPDPNNIMEFASLINSGAFDDASFAPSQGDSLVKHVAQKLGTTPQELAKRTRPKNPSTLLGVDLGVY